MNVLTIYIGGVPACGKSTIFKHLRQDLFADAVPMAAGLCRYIQMGDLYMIGVFDGSTFEGTDKLSMTAIGDCISFVRRLESEGGRKAVLVEGDRLFCERFIKATRARVFVVEAHRPVIEMRRRERRQRGQVMTDTFLKSRDTKVEKLALQFRARRLPNNTPVDLERNIQVLKTTVESWTKKKGN